jgi:hypothetical protein
MSRLAAGAALGGSLSSMGSLPGVQGYPLFKIKRLLSVRGGGHQPSLSTSNSSLHSSTSSVSSSPSMSLSTSLESDWVGLSTSPPVTIRLVAAAGVKNYSLMALACSNGVLPPIFIIYLFYFILLLILIYIFYLFVHFVLHRFPGLSVCGRRRSAHRASVALA